KAVTTDTARERASRHGEERERIFREAEQRRQDIFESCGRAYDVANRICNETDREATPTPKADHEASRACAARAVVGDVVTAPAQEATAPDSGRARLTPKTSAALLSDPVSLLPSLVAVAAAAAECAFRAQIVCYLLFRIHEGDEPRFDPACPSTFPVDDLQSIHGRFRELCSPLLPDLERVHEGQLVDGWDG